MKHLIYTFWTGDNQMSAQRKECLDKLREVSKVEVILVTPANLNEYILEEHPLHPSYQYLSLTHKADYLRTYFMNFHGGGYSDIKRTTGEWVSSFEALNNSDKWVIGYQEIEGGVAYSPLSDKWAELIGNGAYICKPNTEFTNEWYSSMIKLLDTKLRQLELYPAQLPQDCSETTDGKYPIEWNEMLGRIFHKISYNYKDKILNTLPISNFDNYR